MLVVGLGYTALSTAAQSAEPSEVLPLNEKWLGDFDGMAERREIRALVVYSKTFYFLDQGRQRGASYELLKEFEKFVNKKLKTKTLKIKVLFIPVRRDQLIPWLVEGRGDIAAANLTITPLRQQQVDFSDPLVADVKELLVTGPSAPPVKSLTKTFMPAPNICGSLPTGISKTSRWTISTSCSLPLQPITPARRA